MIDLDSTVSPRVTSHEECTPADKKQKFVRRPGSGGGMGYRGASRSDEPTYNQRPKATGSPFTKNLPIGGKGPRIGIIAFNKHIAAEMQTKLATGKEFFIGSPEQDAIWDAMLNDESHLLINASAGSGKSSSAQQGVLRLIREKDASAKAMTYHSLGLSILRNHYGKIDLDEHKLDGLIDQLAVEKRRVESPKNSGKYADKPLKEAIGEDAWYHCARLASQLVRLCKHYLYDGTDKQQLIDLADYHNVDYDEQYEADGLELVPKLIALDLADPKHVDFDDMTWLPVALKLQADLFDILIIDESQDTDRTQQSLAKLACPKGRIIAIGDKKQAIYSFRGADSAAMDRIEDMLFKDPRGCQILPLTVTRRCPKKHVEIAQYIVGDIIQSMDTAIDGVITQTTEDRALASMRPGDLVVCRVNKFLIPACYELIQRGIKAIVRGRDIGAGLEALIKKLGSPETTAELSSELSEYFRRESQRLHGKKNSENRIAALNDRVETLHELLSGTTRTSEVLTKIRSIFADFEDDGAPRQAVILGTIHRTKGLEADRVFVLAPDLIPHPLASKQWEIESESNLAYVACTRAKKELIFCGQIPEIYGPAIAAVTWQAASSGEPVHVVANESPGDAGATITKEDYESELKDATL